MNMAGVTRSDREGSRISERYAGRGWVVDGSKVVKLFHDSQTVEESLL